MEKQKFDSGDFVEISLSKEKYRGTYLESPESGLILLKLENGYNIGFNKKDILKINKIKNFKEEKKLDLNFTENLDKPGIVLIVTGGTISSRLNPGKGGVDFVESPEDLFLYYPEIFNLVNVKKIEVPFMKGSENLDFKDWQKIAKVCGNYLNDSSISGIIILHGTDSLHFTSAALSFFIRDLNKPVVLTYSQRSTDRASSDARLNLECAAKVATSNIAEVVVVGHANSEDYFCLGIPGTKVRKLHSSKRDAFKPVNRKAFLEISRDSIKKISDYKLIDKNRKSFLDFKFEEKIGLIKFYPGQDPKILDYYVKNGYKGLIIEMLGLGQIATSGSRNSWIKKLKEIQKKGIFVCATSQTIFGRTNPYVYVTGRELVDSGVLYLEDMLSETALVKLGWVLGHKDWDIRKKMLENFSWEINDRIEFE